jgi:hypothetical protein
MTSNKLEKIIIEEVVRQTIQYNALMSNLKNKKLIDFFSNVYINLLENAEKALRHH